MDINDGRQNAVPRESNGRKQPTRRVHKSEVIRTLFLRPVESYDLAEAARLSGMPVASLRREVERRNRDAVKTDGGWRFTWRQVALLAFDRWTLTEIFDALGDDAARVLPPLLALRTVTVRLPEYVLRALEMVAENRGTTLDHFLYGELIDFAGSPPLDVARRIPGYRQAYLYPGAE